MKKILFLLVAGLTLSFFFTSCEKEESFDEALLIGKWRSGTVNFRYNADHTGYTWDTADDVTEEEAQDFTWTLEMSELTHINIGEVTVVPKVYKITELTATTLKYRDSFSVTHSFTKTN
jgi:hypothetical protein